MPQRMQRTVVVLGGDTEGVGKALEAIGVSPVYVPLFSPNVMREKGPVAVIVERGALTEEERATAQLKYYPGLPFFEHIPAPDTSPQTA